MKRLAYFAVFLICTGILCSCGAGSFSQTGSPGSAFYSAEHLIALLNKAFTLPVEGLREAAAVPAEFSGRFLTDGEVAEMTEIVKENTKVFLDETFGPFGEQGLESFYPKYMLVYGLGTIFDGTTFATEVAKIEITQPFESKPSTYYFTVYLNILEGGEFIEQVVLNGRARVDADGLVEFFELAEDGPQYICRKYKEYMKTPIENTAPALP